ncbi:hypothetical protein TNCV_1135391 [Trichonephila clavipes]|nr:hypothetical protein TNCV_1135391 [Trichonephila clavipes]
MRNVIRYGPPEPQPWWWWWGSRSAGLSNGCLGWVPRGGYRSGIGESIRTSSDNTPSSPTRISKIRNSNLQFIIVIQKRVNRLAMRAAALLLSI